MENTRSNFRDGRGMDLLTFDFDAINSMDPSMSQGVHKVLFDEELAMKIHFIEPDNSIHTLEEMEKVRIRIFSCQNDKEIYFRIELTSENDIFFFYMHM